MALLQLQGASGLPTETFGNSSQVSLGTPVLALGNAEGQGGAKAVPGIINALNRSIQASDQGSGTTEDLNHMLQTNAPIEQGDSGGALANNAGQVIGMITAANTSTSGQFGSSGGTLGFAIPINSALAIAKQIASGQAERHRVHRAARLPRRGGRDEQQPGSAAAGRRPGAGAGRRQRRPPGAARPARPPTSGRAFRRASRRSARVRSSSASCAARRPVSQGLGPGDVILSVEGQAITTPDSLTSVTALYHPGDIVSVAWESVGGTRHTSSMMLGSGPAR